jgi:cytochrome P450
MRTDVDIATTATGCPYAYGTGAGGLGTDLFAAEMFSSGDPHQAWTILRRDDPVSRQITADGQHYWAVTRYHDAQRVLRDYERFSSERGTLLMLLGKGDPAGGHQMAATDPPRHTDLRLPLQTALTKSRIETDRSGMRAAIVDLIAPLADEGEYDLAAEMAKMPMAVIAALMNLPAGDQPRLIELTTAAIAPEEPRFARPGGTEAVLKATHRELFAYFQDLVRERRRRSGDDLISLLIEMETDGRRLSSGEIVSNCYSLLLGASVTIAQVPTAAVEHLAGTPAIEDWATDPTTLVSGVEEAIRWSSPTTHFMRYTSEQVTIGDRVIPAGEPIVVWLGSANRDEEVFAEPFTFDVRRRPNKHIAFGVGPHYCVGHTVGRVALWILFAELLARYSDFTLLGPPERMHSNVIAGWNSMPIKVRRRAKPLPLAYE